ncbi:malate dehydrogenase (plasmid) [Azospirillum sp. B510]|uniref:malate/lactate/ureidoglycolate dehydrogenase n=1 Tax=Azospirillum sp. (strain B510) TaxID=137722 RepID=UPI0001C4B8A8|nr:malate/lactate/ureidoglycolate dehydrogenase [Azospirillum sp. B510]BAI74149.1 malate dehydrogenase [Azospirillum sp. B510]
MSAVHIPSAALRRFSAGVLAAMGSSAAEADHVAGSLVDANLCGHDSHGVGLLPLYLSNVKAGFLHPNRAGRVVRDTGAILVVDGEQGYGQTVVFHATELAARRAVTDGLALLAVRNAHHMGRIGAYGEQAAAVGLVWISFVNITGTAPLVAPFGGGESRFGTNPICIAMPRTGADPILLDFATSAIAWNKCRVALNRGEALADGLILDSAGYPTNDPAVMFAQPSGTLLPFGGHKGYGLSFLCELLAGALTGAGTMQPGTPRPGTITNNMLAILIDPDHLGSPGTLVREVEDLVGYVHSTRPAEPGGQVLIPGEPESRMRRHRLAEGVPLDPTTLEQLHGTAQQVGASTEDLHP